VDALHVGHAVVAAQHHLDVGADAAAQRLARHHDGGARAADAHARRAENADGRPRAGADSSATRTTPRPVLRSTAGETAATVPVQLAPAGPR